MATFIAISYYNCIQIRVGDPSLIPLAISPLLKAGVSARRSSDHVHPMLGEQICAEIPTMETAMSDWEPAPYKEYRWIVADPRLLGGKLAIRGTRLSVSLILECLASGMSLADIDEAFAHAFPPEALPEFSRSPLNLPAPFMWLLDGHGRKPRMEGSVQWRSRSSGRGGWFRLPAHAVAVNSIWPPDL